MASIVVSSLVEVRLFFTAKLPRAISSKMWPHETKLEYMTLMMELKQQRREGQEE